MDLIDIFIERKSYLHYAYSLSRSAEQKTDMRCFLRNDFCVKRPVQALATAETAETIAMNYYFLFFFDNSGIWAATFPTISRRGSSAPTEGMLNPRWPGLEVVIAMNYETIKNG
ncbi:hypothetical protein YC2023_082507 [Brassica napus]